MNSPLNAPTQDGWWWAHFTKGSGFVPGWLAVKVRDVNGRKVTDCEAWLDAADRWVGPLIEPGKGEQ